MADNIGNVNLSLGLNADDLEKGMKAVNDLLVEAKEKYKEAFGQADSKTTVLTPLTESLKGTNQTTIKLKSQLDAIRKAWESIDLAPKGEKKQQEVKEITDKLLFNYRRIKEEIDKSSISIDEYAKRLAKIEAKTPVTVSYNKVMQETQGASSINERTAAIKRLQEVQKSLSSTDADYEKKLTAVNRRIMQYADANKKAAATGIELKKQTIKFGEAAEWASRKLVFYTSLYTLGRMVNKLTEIRGEFELQQKSLAAIIQNKYAADKIFGQIVDLALQSPFRLKELISYTKELSAYRIETEKLFDTTKMLADVSAGLGVDMGRLILAYGQVRSASVLRGQELRQFTEAGIPLVGELAKQFSILYGRVVKNAEVFDLISNRMVSFEMVDQIFKDMTKSGGMFYNMQKIQAETLKGKISNLTDAIDIMFNNIGKGSEGFMKNIVDALRSLVQNYDILIKNLYLVISALGIYKLNLFVTNKIAGEFGANVIKGSLALSAFKGETYAAAMATIKANMSFKTMSGAMAMLQKAAIVANVAMQSLKAAFLSFLPTAIIIALAEVAFYLMNISKKNKEFRDSMDAAMVSTMGAAREINTHIDLIRKLNSELKDANISDAKRNELLGQRASIITTVAQTEGDLASVIATNIDNQEALNKAQEDYNNLKKYELLLNNLISESGGERSNIKALMDEKANLEAKSVVYLGQQQALFSAIEGKITQNIIKTKSQGLQLSDTQKKLEAILNSSDSVADKFKKISKEAQGSSDIIKIIWGYSEQLGDVSRDIVDNTKKTTAINAELDKKMKVIIDNTRAYWTGIYGDLGKVSTEQINNIKQKLSETFTDKEYVIKILASIQTKEQQSNAIQIVADTWQDKIRKMIKGTSPRISEILRKEGATWLSALDDIAEAREKDIKDYQKYVDAGDALGEAEKAARDSLKREIENETRILNAFNYNTDKREAQKDFIIEREKNRIDVIEKAIALYDDYIEKIGETSLAKDAVLKSFGKEFKKYGIKADEIFSSTEKKRLIDEYSATIAILEKNRKKKNSETTDDLIRDLTNKIGKVDFEINIKARKGDIEAITDKVDKLFSDFELTNELGGFKNLASAILPNPITYEQLLNQLEELSKQYTKLNTEESLKAADDLQKKIRDLKVSETKRVLSDIKDLQEKMQTEQDKIVLTNTAILEDEKYLLYVNGLGRMLTENERNLKLLAELRLKYNKDYLAQLEETTLKEGSFYQRLFGDVTNYSARMLKDLIKQANDAISSARDIGGGKKEIAVLGDNGELEKKVITTEVYLSLIKQVTQLEEEQSKLNPFGVAIKYIREYIQGLREVKQLKEEEESIQRSITAAKRAGDVEAENALQVSLNNNKEKQGKVEAENTIKQAKGLKALQKGISDTENLLGGMMSLGEALGADENLMSAISGVQDMLGGLGDIVSGLTSGNPMGVISGIVSGISKALKGLTKIHNTQFNSIIEDEKQKLEVLERAYAKLEKAQDDAFNLSNKVQDLSKMQDNIKAQIDAINKMRVAESQKKGSDEKAIRDYNNQIEDLNEKAIELNNKWLEELRGISITTAAEDFATIWIDALLSGENAMDKFGDKFDDMIKQMIVKQAALRVTGNIIQPLLDQIDASFGADGILTPDEVTDIVGRFPDIMSQMNSAMEAIIKPLLDAAGLTVGSTVSTGGLQADITAIQEETAGQLVALLNTMRRAVFEGNEYLQSIDNSLFATNSIAADSLAEIRGIHIIIQEMREWQKSVTFAGHQKGGNGIKIFYGE